jgi:hypothetical protein
VLTFGSDLSNYYHNHGLKVFTPRCDALERIVNYRDPRAHADAATAMVSVGAVRYASSHRAFQQVDGLAVSMTPTDLLGQKTALFGMTRTGKSNTTKIVLKTIFELRWQPRRCASGKSYSTEWRICERERPGRGRTVVATWRKWPPINRKRVASCGR